jgi:Phasin protein
MFTKRMGASMSNQSAKHKSFVFGDQDVAWKQFEAVLRWNAQAFAVYSTIGGEIQSFIARRVTEDFAVGRAVSQSRTPHELMAAYTDFWRRAAEDYGKEVTTIAKLMTNATSKMVAAAQPAVVEEQAASVPWREAAE